MPVSISFVVPAYNEREYIEQCLNAIHEACADLDIQTEIIVIDNGSTDATPELARGCNAQVFTIERTSVSAARNLGADKASHPVIAFIDADVVITRRWATICCQQFETLVRDGDTLTGHQYAIRPNRSWIEEHWFGNLHDKFLAGGNIIISKELFHKIDGFDVDLKTGEDFDLCERAIAAGANYYEEPGYEAIHLGFPRTLSHFVKREIWHGEGDFHSLSRFLSSKVAMIAMLYLGMHLLVLLCVLTGRTETGLLIFSVLLLINLMLTVLRFRHAPLASIVPDFILNYAYFCARGASFFSALLKKKKQY